MGSRSFKDPAQAFLGLANGSLLSLIRFLFKSSNLFLFRKISPLTSSIEGGLLPNNFNGIDFIVLIFSVTSSPVIPSPLVAACIRYPFSYLIEIATPSIFGSII